VFPMKIPVFLDMTPCRFVHRHQHFGGAFCCRLQFCTTLKMKAETSVETLVPIYQYTQRHIPEDRNLQQWSFDHTGRQPNCHNYSKEGTVCQDDIPSVCYSLLRNTKCCCIGMPALICIRQSYEHSTLLLTKSTAVNKYRSISSYF
jgi:hypothetical protein